MMSNVVRPQQFQQDVVRSYGGGYGGGDGTMWAQSVETRLGQLHDDLVQLRSDVDSDFRLTWRGLIAAFLLLAALISSFGFGWLGPGKQVVYQQPPVSPSPSAPRQSPNGSSNGTQTPGDSGADAPSKRGGTSP